jgi:LysM repeat protein
MLRYTMLILIAAVLIAGCTLATEQESTDSAPTTQNTREVTTVGVESATKTPQPTATPTERTVSSANTTVPTSQPCNSRTDWPLYTVQRGDTTSSIAQRINSTVATLAAANCLTNAALIREGQQLHLPSLPPSSPVTAGSITVNPYQTRDGDTYVLKVNRSVIVTWNNVPSNVARVEFYITPNFTDYQQLSEDTNASDGANFVLVVPVGLNGYMVASGKNASGQEVAVSPGLPVRADTLSGVVGDIFVSPFLSRTDNGYIVQEGQTIQLSWGRAQGQGPQDFDTIQAEFTYRPASGNASPISIGIDTNPADGFTVNWTVPANVEGTILVGARLPGETHNTIASISRSIRATPALAAGSVSVEPVLRTEGGWTFLAVGSTVKLSWEGLSTTQITEVESVDFYLAPTGTGIDLDDLDPIATDNNPADGISAQWSVPPGFSGHLVARARRTNGTTFDTANLLSVVAE